MSNYKPLVSVVIPTYKRSDRLIKSIESIINQTYKNLEIIVVDDNNPKENYRLETKNKLKKYIDSKSIIYIENEKNVGGAIARNIGIQNATGEYIAFLDDDDIFLPTKIEKQVQLFIDNQDKNLGLVYCYANGVDEKNNIVWTNKNNYSGLPLYESMTKCIAGTPLWLCDTKMLKQIGGFEDTPSKQDMLLMVKIIANNYSIMCVEEILINCLEHEDERISSKNINKSTIQGLLNFRDYSRIHYNNISKKQLKNIEYKFSRDLCILFISSNNDKEIYSEFFNMIKIKPLCLSNIKMLIRILKNKIGDI